MFSHLILMPHFDLKKSKLGHFFHNKRQYSFEVITVHPPRPKGLDNFDIEIFQRLQANKVIELIQQQTIDPANTVIMTDFKKIDPTLKVFFKKIVYLGGNKETAYPHIYDNRLKLPSCINFPIPDMSVPIEDKENLILYIGDPKHTDYRYKVMFETNHPEFTFINVQDYPNYKDFDVMIGLLRRAKAIVTFQYEVNNIEYPYMFYANPCSCIPLTCQRSINAVKLYGDCTKFRQLFVHIQPKKLLKSLKHPKAKMKIMERFMQWLDGWADSLWFYYHITESNTRNLKLFLTETEFIQNVEKYVVAREISAKNRK
jgi:hypothetical protein